MSKPTPTPEQIAAINAQTANLKNLAASLQGASDGQASVIARDQLIDDAFNGQFSWYNDSVISKYDAERKAINGTFVISPITNADLVAAAQNPPTGRLVPTPPATAILRIPEFDAPGYTGTTLLNESQNITDEGLISGYLTSGFSGTAPTVTLTTLTTTTLTALSTTLGISDAVGPAAFAIGNTFIVQDGGSNAAVVTVTSVTPVGSPPPYVFILGIHVVVPPAGTIAIGSHLTATFTGFTNGERATKTASVPALQPLMNSLVAQLQATLNGRFTRLSEQITAINANQDPDAVTNLATAKTNAMAAQTFITAYLISTSISDTGLASLAAEASPRSTFLTTRISQILAAYTGQTENYYDKRYAFANNRSDSSTGTLRALANAQNVQTTMANMAAQAQNNIAQLNSILP